MVSGNVEVLTTQFSYHAEEISDNRLMLGTTLDSIYVLKLSNGVFSLQHKIRAPGYGYFNVMGVSESANYISVSRILFDQSFVPKHELDFVGGDNPNFFIGLSEDGAFAATFHNQVISTSSMQEVRRYGDGFGSVTYFSPDNNVMYHFTEGDLNIRWNPPPRLFRYPWR